MNLRNHGALTHPADVPRPCAARAATFLPIATAAGILPDMEGSVWDRDVSCMSEKCEKYPAESLCQNP